MSSFEKNAAECTELDDAVASLIFFREAMSAEQVPKILTAHQLDNLICMRNILDSIIKDAIK